MLHRFPERRAQDSNSCVTSRTWRGARRRQMVWASGLIHSRYKRRFSDSSVSVRLGHFLFALADFNQFAFLCVSVDESPRTFFSIQ
jgi:hypothetical protein